jgi:ornithine--oxo-acid transaminase
MLQIRQSSDGETRSGPDHSYEYYVNPQWVRLLNILQMNVQYVRCQGVELYTSDGRRILDFIAGYCVHNAGHNHPTIIRAIKAELERHGPAMLQSHVPQLAGELAKRLCQLAGGRLTKVFFASSGSEGIETVIKFARAHTGRPGLLSATGGFHGLTCGALSLMENAFWKEGFGSFLPDTDTVSFGCLEELARKLSTQHFAAFVVEPLQAEAGIIVPSSTYLQDAQSLCRRYGTLFVLDEVQTGLHRTGPFLAAHHFGLEPDMVVLAKALSGGLVPCSAVLMCDAVCASVYHSLPRAFIHTSTYSENSLAMRAGLATLDVLEEEQVARRATVLGEYLRQQLKVRLASYEMIDDIRGLGLLCGIAFKPPSRLWLRIPFAAFARIHPGMFGQVVVMQLFRDEGVLSQICGNHFMVLKVAPPLVVREEQLEEFLLAIERVVERMHTSHTFWSEPLGLASRSRGASQ